MRISRDKTEVMVTSREPIQRDIELDGETLKQVEQLKYLGSIFVREGDAKRMSAKVFYQLSPILGRKEISMTTKTQIINTNIIHKCPKCKESHMQLPNDNGL